MSDPCWGTAGSGRSAAVRLHRAGAGRPARRGSPGTVTHDDGRPRDPEPGTAAGRCPPDDVHAVVDGSRPRVLRSTAEVDAQHGRAGPECQSTACPIVRLQIADRPHPSVEEHHQWPERRRRAVETGRHGSRADHQILDVVDLGTRRPGFGTASLRPPQLRRTHGTGGRSGVLPNSLDEGGQFGVGEGGIDRFGHAGQDATLIPNAPGDRSDDDSCRLSGVLAPGTVNRPCRPVEPVGTARNGGSGQASCTGVVVTSRSCRRR